MVWFAKPRTLRNRCKGSIPLSSTIFVVPLSTRIKVLKSYLPPLLYSTGGFWHVKDLNVQKNINKRIIAYNYIST
jgi:hypothetical protein